MPTASGPQPAHLQPTSESDAAGVVLDLAAIHTSLRQVQENFPSINVFLKSRRDHMDDRVVDNVMAGYAMIDDMLARNVDLFSLGHLRLFLELNATVLCGRDAQARLEAATHLAANEKHFYDQEGGGIRDVMEWYELNAASSAWGRASGVYVRMLSEPQLFLEGNHRTGALVMSYVLAREGHPPFVLTVGNARAYFDPSTLITTERKHTLAMHLHMSRLKNYFAEFLQAEANPKYLQAAAGTIL
jgi:hypothetical protein